MKLENTPENDLALNDKVSNKKRLFIKTYGCQMNVYDSHRMADSLKTLGYDLTKTQEDADLIVLNTCHIREKAAEKVYSEIGRLKSLKKTGELMIAVAGCASADRPTAPAAAETTTVSPALGCPMSMSPK